jgi:hypothetical protein
MTDHLKLIRREHPAWEITYNRSLGVWSAERKTGHTIHVLIAYDVETLATKLADAEAEEG